MNCFLRTSAPVLFVWLVVLAPSHAVADASVLADLAADPRLVISNETKRFRGVFELAKADNAGGARTVMTVLVAKTDAKLALLVLDESSEPYCYLSSETGLILVNQARNGVLVNPEVKPSLLLTGEDGEVSFKLTAAPRDLGASLLIDLKRCFFDKPAKQSVYLPLRRMVRLGTEASLMEIRLADEGAPFPVTSWSLMSRSGLRLSMPILDDKDSNFRIDGVDLKVLQQNEITVEKIDLQRALKLSLTPTQSVDAVPTAVQTTLTKILLR